MTLHPLEDATVRAFVVPARRERWLALLASPKRRSRVLFALDRGSEHFDPRFASVVPPDRDVGELLCELGAPPLCHVISHSRDLDGRDLPLDHALAAAIGFEIGTLVCCLPRTLACYIGVAGEPRLILSRPPR